MNVELVSTFAILGNVDLLHLLSGKNRKLNQCKLKKQEGKRMSLVLNVFYPSFKGLYNKLYQKEECFCSKQT